MPDPTDSDPIEIPDPPQRNWTALASYALLYLALTIVLILLFLQLSVPLALTAGLASFMVAYMLLMGWISEGKLDRRE